MQVLRMLAGLRVRDHIHESAFARMALTLYPFQMRVEH
jgi:hypothetical protein